MVVVEVNSVRYGSTGNIAKSIAEIASSEGDEVHLFVPCGRHNGYHCKEKYVHLFGFPFAEDIHIAIGRIAGLSGLCSVFSTLSLVNRIKKLKPSIVHLHNLHNSYVNYPILFSYLKRSNVPVVWTLHDCWAFTGHCPHFFYEKCRKWMEGCYDCVRYKKYPKCLFDDSKFQYKLKKKCFSMVSQLYVVTPSDWLANLVKKSFLKPVSVNTINNGVDLSCFRPIENNQIRERYNIPQSKNIVLCVAMNWNEKKGLDVVLSLSKRLPREKYQIIIVGTGELELPSNLISIRRTKDQDELAMLYSAADVFVNPTREEVLGLVNIEALACGTPGITFDVGGSPECYDETCGSVVPCDDLDALEAEIIRVCEQKPYSKQDCVTRARRFDKNIKYKEYVKLYDRIVSPRN